MVDSVAGKITGAIETTLEADFDNTAGKISIGYKF